MAASLLLEEIEDRGERVGADRKQSFVHQGEAQFGLDRPSRLVGDGDLDLALLAREEGFLHRLERDLEFAFDGELLVCGAQVAPVQRRHRQPEVRKQVVPDLDWNPGVVLPQFDDLVAEDGFPLVGDEGQSLLQAGMQAHGDVLADLEGGRVGEEPQLGRVVGSRYQDLALLGDRLPEAIGAGGAQPVDAALVELEGQTGLAGGRIGGGLGGGFRDLGRLRARALAPRQQVQDGAGPGLLDAQDGDLQRLPHGFAVGAGGGQRKVETLAGDDHRLARPGLDREAEPGQGDGLGHGHVLAVERSGERQGGARPHRRRIERKHGLALAIGGHHPRAAVGKGATHDAVGQRLAPVEGGGQGGFDRLAAEPDPARKLHRQPDFPQRERTDLEGALEMEWFPALAVLVGGDHVLAVGSRLRQCEGPVDRSEPGGLQ